MSGPAVEREVAVAVFACRRSGYLAMRELTAEGLPPGIRSLLVELPCGCAIDERMVLRALERGADAVLALVCYERSCQSLVGNVSVEKRIGVARRVLEEIGLSGRPVELRQVSAASAARCREALEEIAGAVRAARQGGSEQ